ncbi:antibiotic biosynthesis monooxygenase [Egicoccus sp. AB-alg2]|uniref:antibiotic biosynthesis monooxygenase n=1 Tax=Egicoccus sp. AB-alg2 TaxID=3242693 RepID=UPI00359CC363
MTAGPADPAGTPTEPAEPVTVVISRLVRPGMEAAYEAWVHDIGLILTEFPGAEGITVLPPGTAHSGPEWVLVLRFRDYEAMVRWKRSDLRARWIARLDDLTVDTGAWEEQTGLETWFTLDGRPTPTGPPPRWKQAILTTLGLVPLLLASNALLAPLTAGWPGWLRTVVVTPFLVALMTWAVMPTITRAVYGWLYPGQR